MVHLFANIFVLLLILGAGWLLFVAWILGMIVRGIWTTVSRVTGIKPPPQTIRPIIRKCEAFRCGAANPPSANFCRRCGTSLARPAMKRPSFNSAARRQWASSPVSL
jgi:ribosomal protein L40E